MKQSGIIKRLLADKNFIQDRDGDYCPLQENYFEYLANRASLETILKDKKYLKNNKKRLNGLIAEYLDYILDNEETATLKPKPKVKTNYVGVEIECFTHLNRLDLLEKLSELGLDKVVQPTSDGSIAADFGDDCELRILLPEKQLASGLKKISKLFTKGKFGVNDTCGLHIHLDMRNRNVDECYKRLLDFQDILFGMVKTERWNNTYCKYTSYGDKYNRYASINKEMAYQQHKTIEVRLHHATLDMKQIEQWIKLLLKVIGTKTPPPKQTKANVVEWGKKQKLGPYVSKNFNESWFKEKKRRLVSGDYFKDEGGYE